MRVLGQIVSDDPITEAKSTDCVRSEEEMERGHGWTDKHLQFQDSMSKSGSVISCLTDDSLLYHYEQK